MNKLIAYVGDFVSYVLEYTDRGDIRKAILFGSVARDEADSFSDIDIFFDTTKADLKGKLAKIHKDFLNSVKYRSYWSLKGVKNRLNPIVGDLTKWADLRHSIASNSIVLFGAYNEIPKTRQTQVMISWENVHPESKRVMLHRQLFGFVANKKKYKGLVDRYNAVRLGKGTILVPLEAQNEFIRLFREKAVTIRIKQLSEIKA